MSPRPLPEPADARDSMVDAGRKVMQVLHTARVIGDPALIACAELAAYFVGCKLAQPVSDTLAQE